MPIAEFALGWATSLARSKLTGKVGTLANVAENLLRRYNTKPEARDLDLEPGDKDWFAMARSRPDPHLNIYWYADLPMLPVSIDGGAVAQLPWYFIEEVTLPQIEFEQFNNYRAGKNYHYPNSYNLNTLQVKTYGDVSAKAINYFTSWQLSILDPSTGLYFTPDQFKKPIKITTLDATNLTVAIFELHGCWPTNVDQFVFTSGQADRITPTITFSVDSLVIKVGKFEPGMIPSVIDNVNKDFPVSLAKLP